MTPENFLPLKIFTPLAWAEMVLTEKLSLLSDHAHLEKKAASNALTLLQRWPDGKAPEVWTKELGEIARDEAAHLSLVLKHLEKRGGTLAKSHRNLYTGSLNQCIRKGRADHETLDRLIVSALIEARSCERFYLLAKAAENDDRELAKLYSGLWSSERGHYESFLMLAREFMNPEEVKERFKWFLERESEIISNQEPSCAIHSWITTSVQLQGRVEAV